MSPDKADSILARFYYTDVKYHGARPNLSMVSSEGKGVPVVRGWKSREVDESRLVVVALGEVVDAGIVRSAIGGQNDVRAIGTGPSDKPNVL
jgi:hypothetical protein